MGLRALAPDERAQNIEYFLSEIESGRAISAIVKDEACTVSSDTFFRAVSRSPEIAARYARARAIQASRVEMDMVSIEDQILAGSIDHQTARTVLESMRWRAAKLAPKVYGDRLDVSVTETRISITGALEAARARVASAQDISDADVKKPA